MDVFGRAGSYKTVFNSLNMLTVRVRQADPSLSNGGEGATEGRWKGVRRASITSEIKEDFSGQLY